ncbi:type VII secretion-associated serine protease mycosin [Streptomyces longwoodensis]|uniref:type VII secretion-associated serine protease mycosin n=1 Tax=Streptomyces longwoodensis TaxID=68231 RepID=UPI002E813A6C|nr:type VII secretion-associated serine protease mycosin [Streptomyces longwoodensis]WUC58093.1 type VII secretion-associated serine protease mycosin [Streptomyces longwoodensis]
MHTSSIRHGGRRTRAAVALALLLVGTAGAPATADSSRQKQWFLDAMRAEEMWRTSTGEGVTVAVIDSGVDPTNPDLQGRVLSGKDFAVDQPGDEHTDYDGHGTGMAGLIAGTGAYGGGRGAFGLAPGAKVLPIRLPKDGEAANEAAGIKIFNDALAPAIRYATDQGAKVINISSAASDGSPQVSAAVRYALDHGSLIFAGVGNNGAKANQVMYPAATPGVVGVAAVGKDLRRTAVSEYGPQVDMAAPGQDMIHACGGKTGLCRSSGTSDATALASASAALIWSVHPDWTNNQVLRVMLNTIGAPTDGAKRNDSIGYGIVRPRIALTNPGDPGPADVYPLPDLKAAASAPPSTAPSKKGADTKPAAAQDVDGDSVPWVAVAAGAAVLLTGVIAGAMVVTRRRKRAAVTPPTAVSGQVPYPAPGYGPPPGTSDPVHRPGSGPGGF